LTGAVVSEASGCQRIAFRISIVGDTMARAARGNEVLPCV
jgi:hypothetical protein